MTIFVLASIGYLVSEYLHGIKVSKVEFFRSIHGYWEIYEYFEKKMCKRENEQKYKKKFILYVSNGDRYVAYDDTIQTESLSELYHYLDRLDVEIKTKLVKRGFGSYNLTQLSIPINKKEEYINYHPWDTTFIFVDIDIKQCFIDVYSWNTTTFGKGFEKSTLMCNSVDEFSDAINSVMRHLK